MIWDNAKAGQLRKFLSEPTGVSLIENLREYVDSIEGQGTSFETTALSAKEAKGGRDIIRRIIADSNWLQKDTQETMFVDTTL